MKYKFIQKTQIRKGDKQTDYKANDVTELPNEWIDDKKIKQFLELKIIEKL